MGIFDTAHECKRIVVTPGDSDIHKIMSEFFDFLCTVIAFTLGREAGTEGVTIELATICLIDLLLSLLSVLKFLSKNYKFLLLIWWNWLLLVRLLRRKDKEQGLP